MISRRSLSAAGILLGMLSTFALAAERPGLIATISDAKHSVQTVVPTPNFTLSAQQSLHPQIDHNFKAEWTGRLNLLRGGTYTLNAPAKIEVDGKEVQGQAVKLAAGGHDIKITYERKGNGASVLLLSWATDFFSAEPLPSTALSHDVGVEQAFATQTSVELGRELVEQSNCVACHFASRAPIKSSAGPDLSEVASRTNSDWLHTWLNGPKAFRSQAIMPKPVLSKQQISDVTALLATLGEPVAASTKPAANDMAAGKELFETIGCSSCHNKKGVSLAGVGKKYSSVAALAKFLVNPLHVDPSGRMPQMFNPETQADEARQVAAYLYSKHQKPASWHPYTTAGDSTRGLEVVQTAGCVNCHSVKQGDKLLESKLKAPGLSQVKADKGCLSSNPAAPAVNYEFNARERQAITAYLASQSASPDVHSAPGHAFYRRAKQQRCTSCHQLNELGPGPDKVIDENGLVQTFERPPSLSDAGTKLSLARLNDVLLNHKRNRPWLKLRMPHFGEAVASLPTGIVASTGKSNTGTPTIKGDAKKGLAMLGTSKEGLSCIACHNYRGINRQKAGVVPAPDLAEIGSTLKPEWFQRWLRNPPRLQPGTSMPQFFVGQTEEDRDQNIAHLWAALSQSDKLPLPTGLLTQDRGSSKVVVHDLPVLLRVATKLPDYGLVSRAINVGMPGGLNYSFDPYTSQLCVVWKGEFIDAGPAWNGRGGNPVNVRGEVLHAASKTFPLRVGSVDSEPSVRFRGYTLIVTGQTDDGHPIPGYRTPVFRYEVDGVAIRQMVEPTATGATLHFEIAESKHPIFYIGGDKPLKIDGGKTLKFSVDVTGKK